MLWYVLHGYLSFGRDVLIGLEAWVLSVMVRLHILINEKKRGGGARELADWKIVLLWVTTG